MCGYFASLMRIFVKCGLLLSAILFELQRFCCIWKFNLSLFV